MSTSLPLRDDVDPLIEPLRDNDFLVELIATVSDVDRAEVAARFLREHGDPGLNVRQALRERGIRPYRWTPELESFYADTDAFLYESLVWNRTAMKNEMRQWIGEHLRRVSDSGQRILTFGDGLGLDAYYLASLGHQVTYFDVSQQCSAFASRIFERGQLPVEMLANPDDLAAGTFDVVLCLDVLEHVPDPASLVSWLSSMLRDRGRLIVHAPFYFLHPSVGTHLRSNKRFSGDLRKLYRPSGLRLIDGRLNWNPIVLEKTGGDSAAPGGRAPLAVLLGGCLLSIGRLWSLPHSLVARQLVCRSRPQLKAMTADLASPDE